jgi:hypothetical protein
VGQSWSSIWCLIDWGGWGLIDWSSIVSVVGWRNVVWGTVSWGSVSLGAGGDAVDGAGVDLGWAVLDVFTARSDGDKLIRSIGMNVVDWGVVDWSLGGVDWSLVHWGGSLVDWSLVDWLGWLVVWAVSADAAGGVDWLGLLGVVWGLIPVAGKGTDDDGGRDGDGGEMHFDYITIE